MTSKLPSSELAPAIGRAADLIARADGLVIAAGGGMAADSGLPDVRTAEGLQRLHPAYARDSLTLAQVASPAAFRDTPAIAWGYYGLRLALYRQTQPHEGFEILRRWSRHTAWGAFVFTTNVDGQFQRAGFEPTLLDECHGSVHWLQCLYACTDEVWSAEGLEPHIDENAHWVGEVPRCPRCGALARPNVLLYGDEDFVQTRSARQRQRLGRWLKASERPLVIELGAGTVVPTVRYFSQQMLLQNGARLVRINPSEASVPTEHDVGLSLGAVEALQMLDAELARRAG